ncbi:cation efflux family protein [Drechmeria coniospora]|uniref:Cation efflux family protein n=1 Tax=Drechmeria coniospora TaxID=98403 RepID=A0A151GXC9_DRECN|nr:cation efflux family protein [Drechmeria coniospora]KYK61765.1 cation efflux family protein [Drechmeria coniospora]
MPAKVEAFGSDPPSSRGHLSSRLLGRAADFAPSAAAPPAPAAAPATAAASTGQATSAAVVILPVVPPSVHPHRIPARDAHAACMGASVGTQPSIHVSPGSALHGPRREVRVRRDDDDDGGSSSTAVPARTSGGSRSKSTIGRRHPGKGGARGRGRWRGGGGGGGGWHGRRGRRLSLRFRRPWAAAPPDEDTLRVPAAATTSTPTPLPGPSPSPSPTPAPHRPRPIQTITAAARRARQTEKPIAAASASAAANAALRVHPFRHDHHHLDASISTAPSVLLHLAPVRGRLRSPPVSMGSSQQQSRDHGDHGHGHGHGHHHHHHHDNTYLISANKNDSGVRITRIGLLSNLGMAVAKFIGGWAFNSKSMTADAWHSIADLASDILTLATVSWSLKPPTDRFPMGFGKVESLGSLGVSGMLLLGGFYMGWESAISLFGHFSPETAHILEHMGGGHGHGHSHSHSAASLGIPSIHAAWLAAGTILIKEWLYHATMKVARERRSSVLASNAIHHRVDSLTGFVTLAAILGANVFQKAAWLDPVGGLLISIMVVQAGYSNTVSSFCELADQSIDDEIKGAIRKQAHRALANIEHGHEAELRDISGIKAGQNYLIDLEVAVPGAWKVESTKGLEDAVRTQVGGKVLGVRRVRIRFVSRDAPVGKGFDEFIPGSVQREADPERRENGEEDEEDEPDQPDERKRK